MKSTGITISWMSGVLGLAVLLSACQPAVPSYTPVFMEQACPMEIPPEYSVRCGTVRVPEERQQEEGGQVVLSVAVVESSHKGSGQPPVFVLTGGPGNGVLNDLQYSLEPYRGILDDRPVIFYDQRGTGLSEPALDCPEFLEANQKVYIENLPEDKESQIIMDAYAACKTRLEQSGVSLSAYTTAASADDVRDIVAALAYPEVYLLGISYGTRLGQVTLLRHQSEGWISGAILDSVLPMQVNLLNESLTWDQAVFKYIFRRCAADPKCNERYPDLEKTFYATLDQLHSSPIDVVTFDPITGKGMTVKMDDEDFFNVLFSILYDPFEASRLPLIIDRASRGDTKLLDLPYRGIIARGYRTYEGMSTSVMCAEEGPAIDLDAAHQASATLDPAFQRLAEGNAEDFQKLCQLWDVIPADKKQSRSLKIKLPVLILVGEQDPVTPAAWGELLHQSIPGSYFSIFPGTAHGVFFGRPQAHVCAESLILQFLEDSSQPPDGNCVSELKPFPFRLPSN